MLSAAASAEERLSVGVNVVGGQLSYNPTPAYRLELRYLTASESGAAGTVRSQAFGLRGYKLWRAAAASWRPYWGGELAAVEAKQAAGAYETSGMALGSFVGVERRLSGRLSVGVDAGPYILNLREKYTGTKETGFEVILNSYVAFHVY